MYEFEFIKDGVLNRLTVCAENITDAMNQAQRRVEIYGGKLTYEYNVL